MTNPVVSCENVSVTFKAEKILSNISLTAIEGEMLAILGPNGAGKSTLLNVLAGDITPNDGTVSLGGKPISSFNQHQLAQKRAVLPQQVTVSFPYSVSEVVEMGRGPKTANPNSDLVEMAMNRVEVTDLSSRIYRSLSVGEQARVSIARILAQDAQLLLLDEPTAVLDIGQQEKLMKIVRSLVKEGRTVITVLHDLNVAMSFADRVLLLKGGKQVGTGTPRQTLTPEMLSSTYEYEIEVVKVNDYTGPIVIPSPNSRQ